jgi:hypothetical protein
MRLSLKVAAVGCHVGERAILLLLGGTDQSKETAIVWSRLATLSGYKKTSIYGHLKAVAFQPLLMATLSHNFGILLRVLALSLREYFFEDREKSIVVALSDDAVNADVCPNLCAIHVDPADPVHPLSATVSIVFQHVSSSFCKFVRAAQITECEGVSPRVTKRKAIFSSHSRSI